LFGFLENENQLIDAIDLVLDPLDQRAKRIGDVVDKGIGYPVRSHADITLELFNPPPDVLRMR